MIRFIWKNWWRRKDRFLLLIIGALIISVGFTYFFGLSETSKGTIVDELQERWSSSYDIVVRPEGTRSVTEKDNLLDPNFLSGLTDGISLQQYEQIKNIPNVEVAAPIAMIGYTQYNVNLESLKFDEGIYRLRKEVKTEDIEEMNSTSQHYFASGKWNVFQENLIDKGYEYFLQHLFLPEWTEVRDILLAGIDPEQEAKLIGLDDSIVKLGNSRYFTSEDTVSQQGNGSINDPFITNIPIILSNQSFSDEKVMYTLEQLDIPFSQETANKTIDMLEEKGGASYLDTLQGEIIQSFSFTDQDIFNNLVSSIAKMDVVTGKPPKKYYLSQTNGHFMTSRPSPLNYEMTASPFPDTWPIAYQLKKISAEGDYEKFREANNFDNNDSGYPQITPRWIGFYDPAKLTISKDPTNELPMETYKPAMAELVLDAKLNPINPPKQLKPSNSDSFSMDFISHPPTMLTTLEAAEMIIGEKPISAIRIKVAGVSTMSEKSQKIIENVVNEIERETGLLVDITMGSSPQPALVQVPALNETEELGWFQQRWIKMGSSMTIFREGKVGLSGLILSIIAVAVLYVCASSLVSLLARRKEFAVLLAVGWQPNQLSRLIILESIILGIFVAVISWIVLGFVYVSNEATIDPIRFLSTGAFGLIIYLLGAVIPSLLARNISPYDAMRTGEISKTSKRVLKTKGIISMAFNYFTGTWKRSLLSILAIALPTGLLALFLFITFHLRGVMYTTWLGQYVAMEVGAIQYTAMIIAVIIAILTTAEIMWQNIAERVGEISLLKAVGWRDNSVRLLILTEGMINGIVAAIFGLALALGMMWGLYHQLPIGEMQFILATGFIPIIIGIIGAILPAERAVKISPIHGMAGNYTNRTLIEKKLKKIIFLALLLLIVVLIYTVFRVGLQLG